MNFYVNQSIHIHYLRIGGVTNSSVFQIGSAGMIRATSELKNSGNYTKTLKPMLAPDQVIKKPGAPESIGQSSQAFEPGKVFDTFELAGPAGTPSSIGSHAGHRPDES